MMMGFAYGWLIDLIYGPLIIECVLEGHGSGRASVNRDGVCA
jgi:hypothetical protein